MLFTVIQSNQRSVDRNASSGGRKPWYTVDFGYLQMCSEETTLPTIFIAVIAEKFGKCILLPVITPLEINKVGIMNKGYLLNFRETFDNITILWKTVMLHWYYK